MNWFKNSSLNSKLIGLILMGGGSLLIVGLINFVSLTQIVKYYEHVATINLPKADNLGVMRARIARIMYQVVELRDAYLTNSDGSDHIEELKAHIIKFELAQKAYENISFVAGEEEMYEPIKKDWITTKDFVEKLIKIVESRDLTKKDQFEKTLGELKTTSEKQIEDSIKLAEFQLTQSHKWVKDAQTESSRGQLLSLGAIILFFSLALTFGVLLSRSLSRSFRNLATSLQQGAQEVSVASLKLASSAQDLAQATTEQAASLEETAASIEEMASMVSKNSENSNSASKIAIQSQQNAKRGEEVVKNMIFSMTDINTSNQSIMDAVNQSNKDISEIVQVITEIGNKTKVINDIVFQTKLLSFNASVEAARAGEHGKGFAVVAEEVGNLAQMSGNAAKEISSMLEGSIDKVGSIVRETQSRVERLIEEGQNKVRNGTQIAQQCGEVLHEIVDNVTKVAEMADEISAASNEQSKGVSEISKAMNQLDTVTQQNAQTSDETAAASTELSSQSGSLKETINLLLREIEGSNSSSPKAVSSKSNLAEKPIKKKETKKTASSNVIPIKSKTNLNQPKTNVTKAVSAPKQAEPALKEVSGDASFGTTTPSFDDSRFEDV